MSARDVKVGTLIDVLRWLKGAVLVAVGTPSGSPERTAKLDELSLVIQRARQATAGYQGERAPELRAALGVAEITLAYLRTPRQARGRHAAAEPGASDVQRQ